jgi:UDP-glucose 4-epimerase
MILFLGNGFIGKALSENLRSNKIPHRIISRSISNSPPDKIQADIKLLQSNTNILNNIKTAIYFAHSSVPYSSMQDVAKDAEQNILNAIRLFEIFAKKNIRVVYLSSGGSVYGNQSETITEQTLPSPISAYGVSKYTIENYIQLYHHNFNLQFDILRLSNIYGIGQKNTKPQGVISALAQAFLEKRDFKIWGDGQAKKDYLYIDDLTEALLKVLLKDSSNDTYNVARGVSNSLHEIISLFEKFFGYSIKLEKAIPFDFDVQNLALDNSKFAGAYDWKPKTDIESGIIKTIDWFKTEY